MSGEPREAAKFQIAHCRREDLPKVVALLKEAPEAALWSEPALAEVLEKEPAYFLAGWHGEELAGFIYGRRILQEGEILNLAVRPILRRNGLGQTLVKALLETFSRDGAREIFLEVRASNFAAIKLYTEMNFRQVGERAGYYRDPDEAALVLRREMP